MRNLLMLGLLLGGTAAAVTYTEAQRLQIWKLLDAADVKALKFANGKYNVCVPDPSDDLMRLNADLLDRKTDEFEKVIIKKYKMTDQQVYDLYGEGSRKHWPQIPYSPPGC